MNTRKATLSLAFGLLLQLLSMDKLHSQPYQSLFGNNNTQWVFEWGNLPGFSQDTIFVAKDTLVEGTWWKKLNASRNNIFGFFLGAIIREDTISGKVWYKGFHPYDSTTKLAFDFSLNKGDSFDISCVWGDPPPSDKIVDTTYVLNGRKIIVFKALINKFGERITFIEGIGSNFGIIYKQGIGMALAHYLLCSYKDGKKIFSNKFYNGDCNIHFPSPVNEVTTADDIAMFPNPVKEKLYLKTSNPNLYSGIRIINSLGLTISEKKFADFVNISNHPPGLYFIQIVARSGKIYTRKFIKQ